MLTRYQKLIVKYLEAEYRMPADKAIRFLHKRARYSDIAELVGCSTETLLSICTELGIDDPPTRLSYTPHYKNATEFFGQFATTEDAVIECRDPNRLALSVKDTQKKLGIGRSTIIRHTPDYLLYTYNFSKERRTSASPPSADHPWRQS